MINMKIPQIITHGGKQYSEYTTVGTISRVKELEKDLKDEGLATRVVLYHSSNGYPRYVIYARRVHEVTKSAIGRMFARAKNEAIRAKKR
jgi:hypothetical protein